MFNLMLVAITTFAFPKTMEEVTPPVILPKDWYDVEIVKQPVIRMNNTLKDAVGNVENPPEELVRLALESDEKAGFNLVIELKVEHPDERFNGMTFTIWLGWPSEQDEHRWSRGQKKSDAKMVRIADFIEKFGGSIQGQEFVLDEGMKGCVYIDSRTVDNSDKIENFVDVFGAGFKPYQNR